MTRWDKNAYVSAWQADAQRLKEAAESGEIGRDVPSCPGWTVGDLVEHVARIFLNHERRITATEAPGEDSKGMFDFDLGGPVLAEYDDARQKLAATLDGVRVDDPSWVPAPVPRTARYWFRRLACDTAVHRWDAQMAAAAAEPVDGELAAEGIDEVFDAFVPMGRRREESEDTGVIQLFATDIDRHWFVRLREGRASLLANDGVDIDSTPLQATASASASNLYLALWGRLQVNVLDLTGDESLFRALRVR